MTHELEHVSHSTAVIDRGVLPLADIVGRVRRIQEVMSALMKDGVHYGTIPGTPKPSLYKPGAELILTTFRIAASPCQIDDLSNADEVRYRVTVRGTNQVTGEILGEMAGECSSNEEKYRWRRPVCDEEFDETPVDRRREKWSKYQGKATKTKQVRTSPPDVANTVLKMAIKRALVAMTLVTTAASDIFAQDLEDLPEEMRDAAVESTPKPTIQQPQRKSEVAKPAAPALETTAPSHLVSCSKPVGKKFWRLTLKDDTRFFSTFDEKVAEAAVGLAGSDVVLSFQTTKAGDKTYFNVQAVSAAVPAVAQAEASTAPPLSGDDIFGGAGRQVGEEG